MLQIYKTVDDNSNGRIIPIDQCEPGAWINLTNPTTDEIVAISRELDIPLDFIRAALDEEERPRIESDEGRFLVVIDIPVSCKDEVPMMYTTIPLGIVINDKNIVTICLKENPIIDDFINGRVKTFYTYKKTRFILQILFRNASYFLQYLRQIERISDRSGAELQHTLRNEELIQLLNLKKSLVYFSTSLRSNETVLDKILKSQPLRIYADDSDLLDDVIIENKQAIEMANIYSNILTGTMDAYASIISNNLNNVLKFLTSITIILAIPTMIASFFGMNVEMPLGHEPYGFVIIFFISLIFSVILGIVMFKKNVL